jgi:DNA invertase Pin-like site-specific DNA recombinase
VWPRQSDSRIVRFTGQSGHAYKQAEKGRLFASFICLINLSIVNLSCSILNETMAAPNTTYGYARVSTADQNLDLQLDALKAYGCTAISQEKASAAKDRPNLNKLLVALRPGDTLVVWRLDRLGRSLKHLVDIVTDLQARGIHFVSLNDNMNTSTASGRLVFGIFASLAEFERSLIQERTNAGLTAARARGRVGGRPSGLSKEALSKAEAAKTLYLQQDKTVGEIGKLLGIGRATVYRYLAHLGVATGAAPTEQPDFKFKNPERPRTDFGDAMLQKMTAESIGGTIKLSPPSVHKDDAGGKA